MCILYFNLVPHQNCFHRRANNYTRDMLHIFNFTTSSISTKKTRKWKLLLLKQQGNKKGSKLLLNSTRSCEFKSKGENEARVYFGNGFNDRAVGSNLNKTWRLMLCVKSTNKQQEKNSFNWDLIEILYFGRFIIKTSRGSGARWSLIEL